jgi:putative ABC transport system ATP-binding protein
MCGPRASAIVAAMSSSSRPPALAARAAALCLRTAAGDEVEALRGVTLTVEPGELVAIVGPSSAGKSSLLRLLAGERRPTAGRVAAFGVDPVLLRSGGSRAIAWLPAEPVLPGRRAVLSTTPLGAAAAARAGLAGLEGRRPGELSSGERRRLAVARALSDTRPRAVLADEPARGLDETATADVIAMLAGAATTGRAVLLATTDARVAARCTRAIVLVGGRMVGDLTRPGADAVEAVLAEAASVGLLHLP